MSISKTIVFVFFSLLVLLGCKKNNDPIYVIQGTWVWVKSENYSSTGTISTQTPQTCTCTRTLVFGKDSLYKEYKDSDLIRSGKYYFSMFPFVGNGFTKSSLHLFIQSDKNTSVLAYQLRENALFLNSWVDDGPLEAYIRAN